MHLSAKDVSRKERVKQSQAEGIQREERNIAFDTKAPLPKAKKGSAYDLVSYLPIGNAVEKIHGWKKQGADICYLTSRRIKNEIDVIRWVLKKYHFPDSANLFYRRQGEDYRDVAERVLPEVLIEDDCESIGGESEMTYPQIKPELKEKIKTIPVKEFGGIDHLPDETDKLKSYNRK